MNNKIVSIPEGKVDRKGILKIVNSAYNASVDMLKGIGFRGSGVSSAKINELTAKFNSRGRVALTAEDKAVVRKVLLQIAAGMYSVNEKQVQYFNFTVGLLNNSSSQNFEIAVALMKEEGILPLFYEWAIDNQENVTKATIDILRENLSSEGLVIASRKAIFRVINNDDVKDSFPALRQTMLKTAEPNFLLSIYDGSRVLGESRFSSKLYRLRESLFLSIANDTWWGAQANEVFKEFFVGVFNKAPEAEIFRNISPLNVHNQPRCALEELATLAPDVFVKMLARLAAILEKNYDIRSGEISDDSALRFVIAANALLNLSTDYVSNGDQVTFRKSDHSRILRVLKDIQFSKLDGDGSLSKYTVELNGRSTSSEIIGKADSGNQYYLNGPMLYKDSEREETSGKAISLDRSLTRLISYLESKLF